MRLPLWKRSAGRAREEPAAPIPAHFELGQQGERVALEHLKDLGYAIVAANFKVPVGRNTRNAIVNAEIDLVAYDGPRLCFIEVKTRRSAEFAPPQVNVDRQKQRQVSRAARAYRRMFGLHDAPYRYDVVSVVLPSANAEPLAAPRVEVHKSFWTDESLRRRRWRDYYWE